MDVESRVEKHSSERGPRSSQGGHAAVGPIDFASGAAEHRNVAGPTGKRIALTAAVCGILLELAAVALLAGHRLTVNAAMPLMIFGMFLAFVPLFVVSRNARRR